MAKVVTRVGAEAFDGDRLRLPGTVAVAFLADWCPFCHAFEPEFGRLADEDGATLRIADVTDDGSPLWDRFGLEVVPTVIVFRGGRPHHREDGVPGQGLGRAALGRIRAVMRA